MLKKRIRREIRDLPEREWNAVVAAMWIMKKTSDANGRAKYGDFFVSYDTMVAKHISAALDPAGDQAHFGPVLGIFHRAWLLELENSLLAIDHTIEALPYWDYRRDIPPLQGKFKSIFGKDYMGSYVGQGADYAVLDGKFAKWKISTDSASHGEHNWKNAFGLLRNPISPNKSPYVTRRGGAVCGYKFGIGDSTSWNQCLQVGDNIMYWTSCIDSKVHGPAHSSIAGSWRRDGQNFDSPNCVQWYGFIGAPQSSRVPSNFATTVIDEVYRYGTFVSPFSLNCFSCPTCDKSRSSNDCMCKPRPSCGPLWTRLRVGNTLRKGSRFIDTSDMSPLVPSSEIQILGDLGDPAGSPNDPMFWAHHGNIDRHFEAWMNVYTSPTSRSKYYYFPTKGFAIGCNLNDIISSTAPFRRLSNKRKSMKPYTIKEVFDEFTGDNTPYRYDTLLNARSEMDEMGLQILNESDINSTESAKYESREPLEKLETTNLRGVPRTLATKTSTIIRNIGINRLRTGALVEKADHIINKVDRFINKSLRSTALHSLDLATSSSSGYFSDEFVYATLFLLAILLATLIRFLFKIGIAFMTREGESNLKIAVTADMRQSKYEVLTPDIYLNDHNHSKIRSGVRLRTRTPTSTDELSRKNSTSTNTFLLFSPTIGAE